jgi:hypothetical protein
MKCNEKEWCYQSVRKEARTQRAFFKRHFGERITHKDWRKLERKEHPK